MSEEQAQDAGTDEATSEAEESANQTEEAESFSADYVAKLRRENAKHRKEAKANQDAATELEQIKESQKSQADKDADKIQKLQAEIDQSKADVLRYQVASKYGLSDEDAQLFLSGTDEDTLTRQAERLSKRSEDASKPNMSKPDPAQGRNGEGSAASTADQFAAAVGNLF